MDAKLVNPFVDAFTTVMPQMGFPEPKRLKMNVREQNAVSKGVSVIVGFTKQIRGNVVYNMTEETAKFIASTMMTECYFRDEQYADCECGNKSYGNGAGGRYFYAVAFHW